MMVKILRAFVCLSLLLFYGAFALNPLKFMYDLICSIIEEKSEEFWSRVTDVCSPHQAMLSSDIVSSHLLGVEQVTNQTREEGMSSSSKLNFLLKARQNKLQKKLERQVQLGVISPEMRTAQLEKLGRRNLKKDDEDEGG